MIKKYGLYFFIVGIAFFCGWESRGYFAPRIVTEIKMEKTTPEIQEKIVTQTTTQIQYVEKATDPKTGEKEKTDVEVKITQPSVNVRVNEKPYEFSLLSGEQQKFKDGKIMLNQSSEISLNIKVPTYNQKWRVGGYGSYNSSEKWGMGIRANRQYNGWDFDATANQDKKIGVMITKWF